jgi:hypothetical protein
MSHLSIQTKLDSLFKPALLRSKTCTISESSIDEKMYCLFIIFFHSLHPVVCQYNKIN